MIKCDELNKHPDWKFLSQKNDHSPPHVGHQKQVMYKSIMYKDIKSVKAVHFIFTVTNLTNQTTLLIKF